jgi:cytochrome P450
LTDAGPAPGIIGMDPPEHDRMRALVNRVFTPRAVAALEPMVRDVVSSFLAAGGNVFDAVADFSGPFPVEIICRMLGIPEADRQQLRHWVDAMLHREAGSDEVPPEGEKAGIAFGTYVYEVVLDKRVHPADDMLSRLCQVEVTRDDGQVTRLDDAEIASFASLLAAAGAETVTKLVGSALVLFARHPGEWAKVLDDPGRIPAAVEEALRYWPPSQYQNRVCARTVTLHGRTIPAGARVLLVTGAATRDEREFRDPDRFDIDRPQSLSIAFGHGIHSCLGAALARLESRVALEEWVRRWPGYEIDEAGLRRVHMTNVAGFSSVPVRGAG